MSNTVDNKKDSKVFDVNSTSAKILKERKRKQNIRYKKYCKNKDEVESSLTYLERANIDKLFPEGSSNKYAVSKAIYDTAPKDFKVKKPVDPFDIFANREIANWDDVQDIHRTCLSSLLALGEKVIELTQGVNSMEKNYFDNFTEFEKLLGILGSDMEKVSNDLADIKDNIQDRTGPVCNEEELMLCYDAHQKFLEIMGMVDNVLMPTIYNLCSAFQTAYDRYEADVKGITVEEVKAQYPEDKVYVRRSLDDAIDETFGTLANEFKEKLNRNNTGANNDAK